MRTTNNILVCHLEVQLNPKSATICNATLTLEEAG
jgi:hypothetical protein